MAKRKVHREVRLDMDNGFYTCARDLAMWLSRTSLNGSQLAIIRCVEACCYGWTNPEGDRDKKWKNRYEAAQIPHRVFVGFSGLSEANVSKVLRSLDATRVILRDRTFHPCLYAINPVVSEWDGSIFRTTYGKDLSNWISVSKDLSNWISGLIRLDKFQAEVEQKQQPKDGDGKTTTYEGDLSNWISPELTRPNTGADRSGSLKEKNPKEPKEPEKQEPGKNGLLSKREQKRLYEALKIRGPSDLQAIEQNTGADLHDISDAFRFLEAQHAFYDRSIRKKGVKGRLVNPRTYLEKCLRERWWEEVEPEGWEMVEQILYDGRRVSFVDACDTILRRFNEMAEREIKLTDGRRELLRQRLLTGSVTFSVDDVLAGIAGLCSDEWHRANGRVTLDLVIKTEENCEEWAWKGRNESRWCLTCGKRKVRVRRESGDFWRCPDKCGAKSRAEEN